MVLKMVDGFTFIKDKEELDKWKKETEKYLEYNENLKLLFDEDKVTYPLFIYIDYQGLNGCFYDYEYDCIDSTYFEKMIKKFKGDLE